MSLQSITYERLCAAIGAVLPSTSAISEAAQISRLHYLSQNAGEVSQAGSVCPRSRVGLTDFTQRNGQVEAVDASAPL